MPRQRALRTDDDIAVRGRGYNVKTKAQYEQADVEKVALHPAFVEIPEPTLPLGEQGRKTYDEWAPVLFRLGRLTQVTRGYIETLAISDQAIATSIANGKPPSSKVIENRNSVLRKLEVADIDASVAPTQPAKDDFVGFGFAGRLREAEAAKD